MKRKSRFARFKNFMSEHLVEILMGALFVSGATAGYIYGHDNGYAKGLKEFRKMHIDLGKKLIDTCGNEGAFLSLDLVRSNPEIYEKLIHDPDKVLSMVFDKYYDSEFVKEAMNVLHS